MQDGKGFFFRRFEDMYCRNNNSLPNSVRQGPGGLVDR